MVLVDTSVWVRHLRKGDTGLASLLNNGEVVCHPFIIGEIACGMLKNRATILSLLQALPMATEARHEEVMGLIENHRLMGKGLGYIDVHLLASALATNVPIWTLDKALSQTSSKMRLAFLI